MHNRINKLLVVGLGLIGGSVALAARRAGFAAEYLGVDLAQDERQGALTLGVVDRASESLAELVPEADLLVLAVPVLAMQPVLQAIKPLLKPTAVITDVGSCKAVVLDAATAVFGQLPPRFVLGHPIAGAEKSGVLAARVELFERRKVILTPAPDNDPQALELVRQLWTACGAEVLEMDVTQHDQVLARTSHLPHLLAFSLVDTLARRDERLDIFRYAAGGFRDFTRVAASDPVMWRDIFLANRDATLDALDEFLNGVQRLKSAVESRDAEALVSIFTRAKSARDYFTALLNETGYQTMQNKRINFVTQPGGGPVAGQIRVPGDKSISHRSIMLGALATGITRVKGFLEGEDALATLQTFRDLGVLIEGPHNGEVTIHGVGIKGLKQPQGPLYLGNSGTSMRLLAGILAAQSFDTELTGDASLSKRPMGRVADPLRLMGAEIETAEGGRPPLKIKGGQKLKGITYDLPMASAQVKSCLLLAGLWAEGETRVTEPAPTRDHTERMLQGFGYPVFKQGATAAVQGGGELTACDIDIPADISSATFFMVAAAISPGSDLTLEHVGINPTRDGVINILRLMGADLTLSNQREVGGEPVADIRVRYAPLKGIDIPEDQVPLAIDEFPALFIAAACAEGTTRLRGAEELRVKESDRIQVMADGLLALGVDCTVVDDGIDIQGKGNETNVFGSASLQCHHDHRIAMSFAVAGLRASGSITIEDCATVNTSFPGFAELARSVGLKLDAISG
ncbi:bifunctional prephenate dehydrogenase/3-phosphoshikimate 1-carboxyvinyltransferase [Marinospirillum alkaliphilum]|uniref:bifunctional prephenate dehydrogenase/3-phosphoshikimate 1-carboxyvinyltransferase n=1 Tax=Marinospirillum alkaliphilum TaxID=148454 RepID=UPI000931AC72|nr:bifunctional prephenate dehydrogenase/3-phosphoshikimate 1-carboxyvinyltransferase [Marinospirillum alkaliphilum]